MGRLESFFLSLLLAWTVWVVQGGGGNPFVQREPLIAGGGEKVLVIADAEHRKDLAGVLLSAKWRGLLASEDLVVTDTEDRPEEENFAAAWQANKADAPVVIVEGPKGGDKVAFDKSLTADALRDLCIAKGIVE